MSIRVGIIGYGNLGRGVELAVSRSEDMELTAVFTRRAPETVKLQTAGVPVLPMTVAEAGEAPVDVMILCGGSATDLPEQTPFFAARYNVVDSFDTHARIPEHFGSVDAAAKRAGKVAAISVGWDPGLFSIARLYGTSVLADAAAYTFWGRGVSQGHSDAIRRIEGVADARQYTVPVEAAVEAVRSGQTPELSVREKHTRECYVVAEPGADTARIEREIKEMPNYFADYDTTVHFISMEELKQNHGGIPHGGMVICSGATGAESEHRQIAEYRLQLDSNPEFTAGVLTAAARAVVRMNREGQSGCRTLFDIPPAYLSPRSGEELRKQLL